MMSVEGEANMIPEELIYTNSGDVKDRVMSKMSPSLSNVEGRVMIVSDPYITC